MNNKIMEDVEFVRKELFPPIVEEDEGYNEKLELLSAYAYSIGLELTFHDQEGLTVETYISPHDFD